jgi:hypothetical protein
MVKTPTVVSASTSTETTTTTNSWQPKSLGKNGWARVVSRPLLRVQSVEFGADILDQPGRKQAPQIPAYLKHDMPDAGDDDDDGLDLESDDGITW